MDEEMLRRRQNMIRQLEYIAEKILIYNRDINEHIISCKMSIDLITERDKTIEERSK